MATTISTPTNTAEYDKLNPRRGVGEPSHHFVEATHSQPSNQTGYPEWTLLQLESAFTQISAPAIAGGGEAVVREVRLKHHSPTHGCQEQRSDAA